MSAQYAPICVSLLHDHLEIAVPAPYPTFLSRLSEKAIHNHSLRTIRPVYQAFSSLSFSDLDIMPADLLTRLQDSLIMVLRTHDIEEVSTSLFSLALLARLASWPEPRSTSQKPAQAVDANYFKDCQTLLQARQFFSAKRASKTLDLVALKAIMFCSCSCTLGSNEAIESLQLCTEIVQAVESSERSSWVAKNSGKAKKLCEKVLRSDIDGEVQGVVSLIIWVDLPRILIDHEALYFLTFLFNERNLPNEIVSVIDKLMRTLHCPSSSTEGVAGCLVTALLA